MTESEKLARWQGKKWHDFHYTDGGWYCNTCKTEGAEDDPYQAYHDGNPDYLNDEAAAMSLLDTLVEKGYMVLVVGLSDDWTCQINIGAKYTRAKEASTRREAVVAAVLELIGKEDV